MTLYAILYLVFRNKWLIAAGLAMGLIAAGLAYRQNPPQYRSTAKLLVRYVSDTVLIDPEMSGERVVTPGRPNETLINTELDILTSAELVGSVAKKLADEAASSATNAPPSAPTLTASEVAANFRVQAAKNSNTLLVYFDGPTPEIAQNVLESLIQAYLNKHVEVHKTPGAFEFISRQADEMRTRVNDTEEQLRRIKTQAGITSLLETRTLIMSRIQELDRAIRENEGALAANRAHLRALSQQSGATSATPTNEPIMASAPAMSPETADAIARLGDLYRREAQLMMIYTSNSIPVRSLRLQLEDLKRMVAQSLPEAQIPVGTNVMAFTPPTTTLLATDLAAFRAEEPVLLARLEVLQRQMEVAQADSLRVEAAEAQITRLERTREIYDTNLRYFSQRLEQARIDGALEASKVSNIAIVQSPTRSAQPVTEELFKLLGMIVAAFAAGGVALAVAREYIFDHSIRHPHTIPQVLSVPLLAVLPRLRRLAKRAPRMSRIVADDATEARAAQAWLASCEVVAQIVRYICNRQEGQTLRVGITAPHRGVGVTLVAHKIAEAIHLSGSKSVMLATVTNEGMLMAKEMGAKPTDIQAEDVIAKPTSVGGPVADEWIPTRIPFSAPAPITPRMMDELERQDYDCILYDLPPLDGAEHAVRLLSHLHGVILVVETFRTTVSEAQASIGFLQQLQSSLYGVVLNKFASPVPRWMSSPSPSPPAAPPPLAALPPASKVGREQ